MPTIVVSEMIDSIGLEILTTGGEVLYDPTLWQSKENLAMTVADADALVVRNQTAVTADLLQEWTRLKVVGRLGVGLDNIDLDASRQKKIPVVVARGANAVAVAEYVFAYLFHVCRHLPDVDLSVRNGEWNRSFGGIELHGQTLGLVGLGDIGQRIAFRALSFGMHVMAYDPWQLSTHMAVMDMNVILTDLNDVLERSDFVSVHVPLTPKTRNLMDSHALSRMKRGAYLINTSRGGIVDEDALLSAIQQGTLSGAALDVRSQEPSLKTDKLLDESRILLTPHISGLTREAGVRTATTVAQDVLRVLRGQSPMAAV